MRVAFDASSLAFKQKTGTGVYSEELIKAYEKLFAAEDHIIHTYRMSRRFRGSEFLRPLATKRITRETLLDPLTSFKGLGYDIFHGLNTRLPVLLKTKLIASVHDLFSIYGEFSNSAFKTDQADKLKQMVARSHHIIASCTYTKNQLVEKMGVSEKKVSVVLLGVKDRFVQNFDKEQSAQSIRSRFGQSKPYLFFTGALEKRKNIVGLIKGFSEYRQGNGSEVELVLAGHPGFEYEKIREAIEQSPFKSSIKLLGFVDEGDLAHLYRACSAFVFPSFAEGFGMPVLEAMASGAPVITSQTTSLPEAGGGFAWLVDPHSPSEISLAIAKVIEGSSDVSRQVNEGQIYARAQTWDKVARSTRDVYLKVLALKG